MQIFFTFSVIFLRYDSVITVWNIYFFFLCAYTTFVVLSFPCCKDNEFVLIINVKNKVNV